MTYLGEWVLLTSLKGSVAAVAVLIVVRALGPRLRPAWAHAVCLLVLVRFLLPVSLEAPWSAFGVSGIVPDGLLLWTVDTLAMEDEGVVGAAPASGPGPASSRLLLTGLWSVGFLLVLVRDLAARAAIARVVRAKSTRDSSEFQGALDRGRQLLHVRRKVTGRECEGLSSPVLVDGLSPVAGLPMGWGARLSAASLRHIAIHEVAHMKRSDALWDLIAALAVAVHWFNPLAHRIRRELVSQRELACDDVVLTNLPRSETASYGRTLLEASRISVASATTAFANHRSKRLLMRRFDMIAEFTPASIRARRLAVLGLVLFTMVVMTDPPRGWGKTEPAAHAAAESPSSDPLAPTRLTVERLRSVGTAMYHSVREELERRGSTAGLASSGIGWGAEEMDWSECRTVSAADVRSLVVPERLEAVPTEDGWGHPLEFCLAEEIARARAVVGVRSPGSDGRYSGERYDFGSFPVDDSSYDIVWIDGFFATWPAKDAQGEDED